MDGKGTPEHSRPTAEQKIETFLFSWVVRWWKRSGGRTGHSGGLALRWTARGSTTKPPSSRCPPRLDELDPHRWPVRNAGNNCDWNLWLNRVPWKKGKRLCLTLTGLLAMQTEDSPQILTVLDFFFNHWKEHLLTFPVVFNVFPSDDEV